MSDTPFPLDPEPASQSDAPVEFEPAPSTITLQPRPSLLRFLTEHNPFYLLSAACMLASLLALTNSLSWTSITPTRLLTLIVTLNLYEAALLTIALFLIVRRGLRRDGRILLILQAFFLADFGFLNAEIATADIRTGVAINAVLLVLAAIKMGVVLRVLNPSFTKLQFVFVVAQLAMLFVTPVALRSLDGRHGIVNERQFYVLWWMTGLLPGLYEALARFDHGRIVRIAPDAQAAPTTSYLVLPYVSLLAHLSVLHWIYRVDYVGADAAPLLLGLTLVLNRFSPTRFVSRKDLAFLRVVLPAAAVMVSWNDPFVFTFTPTFGYPRVALATSHLAIAGAFFVYVYCFLLPHARVALVGGLAAALLYVFGPNAQQVANAMHRGWNWLAATAERLVPKTPGDWGTVGLVMSFALLLLGLLISLRKQPDLPVLQPADLTPREP